MKKEEVAALLEKLRGGYPALLPIERVINFWKDNTDSMYDWYRSIDMITSGDIDIETYKAGDEVDMGSGGIMRFKPIQ